VRASAFEGVFLCSAASSLPSVPPLDGRVDRFLASHS
jgi:hypothetical protein